MGSKPKQIKKLYYSIGEVSKLTKLKSYVLRYWETEFRQLSPPKNRAGNRTYRQKDIDTILLIKDLLYNRKFTIKGARTQLHSGDPLEEVSAAQTDSETQEKSSEILVKVKQELESILDYLHKH
ncbi:MAG TPA: MerR family transcriptional regulator [Candidatus Marinimicrobia bacterium]|jgi:DNA-binding transcriptional MerR regulator|nr:transcriptional regulator [Candidatus Neomarinimicrobiota bacterium]HBN45061.1 MerR family transcriptional regulator [Candidatus Neomarinimicrobiota bacterium]HJL74207.1 MerR family transcriptional regulator [Candidatus Neomarinimicrobiota bacterium]HJM70115.1 MerR family transcriptional regulator [Candidatus Neomarinimicrobiota bacterium]|tara:strand:- start:4314 stop:4685 length:372 start_codon:yes stop_codon:yes gene_type:complete